MGEGSSGENIENEAEWIELTLTGILNKHATKINITASSKRWWTPQVNAK